MEEVWAWVLAHMGDWPLFGLGGLMLAWLGDQVGADLHATPSLISTALWLCALVAFALAGALAVALNVHS